MANKINSSLRTSRNLFSPRKRLRDNLVPPLLRLRMHVVFPSNEPKNELPHGFRAISCHLEVTRRKEFTGRQILCVGRQSEAATRFPSNDDSYQIGSKMNGRRILRVSPTRSRSRRTTTTDIRPRRPRRTRTFANTNDSPTIRQIRYSKLLQKKALQGHTRPRLPTTRLPEHRRRAVVALIMPETKSGFELPRKRPMDRA